MFHDSRQNEMPVRRKFDSKRMSSITHSVAAAMHASLSEVSRRDALEIAT